MVFPIAKMLNVNTTVPDDRTQGNELLMQEAEFTTKSTEKMLLARMMWREFKEWARLARKIKPFTVQRGLLLQSKSWCSNKVQDHHDNYLRLIEDEEC